MRKIIILVLLLIATNGFTAPPSRDNVYTAGQTILSADVTANEDAIFNYLQAGVDTYADNTIVNADVNASANIQSDKLNLTSVAQGVSITSSGSLTNAGTTALSGAVTVTGNSTFAGTTIADLGTVTTVDINGGTIDGVTIGASSAPTVTDLGSVATADINGGTIDDVQIDGATTTGTIWYNDSSDNVFGLVPGTDNYVLTSTGTSSAPAWEPIGASLLSTTTVSGASNSGDITIAASKKYLVAIEVTSTTAGMELHLRFNSDSTATAYSWQVIETPTGTWTASTTNDVSDAQIKLTDSVTDTSGAISLLLTMDTYDIDTNNGILAYIHGRGYSFFTGSRTPTTVEAEAVLQKDITITSFEILPSTGNFDATVRVYELGQ